MSSKSATILYKPLGIAAGVAGGLIAGAVFKQVWQRVAGEPDAPNATDKHRGWGAIHGSIVGGINSLVDRSGAKGCERLTGEWPGNDDDDE